ncbi:MAG: PRC-barrel domain [Saliniramus fredricksonii]|uniref:PRC-barrel domain n=2 Tax=Saliniramus fredricksonii TaxID=1653334 RepID=A0A0P7YCL8_9HYPH|nr:MAG: PRC-barrel domain [Saliniramus fredricksonii]SCC82219.1 PRC-barrel domain-containing protein [Saliniramus fredricksonii]
MKHLIATSAIALLVSMPAIGQTSNNDAQMTDETRSMATFIETAHEADVLASEIMEASVLAHGDDLAMSSDAGSTDMRAVRMINADERENLEEIGGVQDVLIDRDGNIRGIIVGVGGFLGIGEREVVLGLDQLGFARDADDPESVMVLAQIDVQSLEEAPEFDREAFENLTVMNGTGDEAEGAGLADRETAEQEADEDETAGQDAEREDMMAESRPAHDAGEEQWRQGREMFTAPDLQREGYGRAEADNFSVDELLGANVYDVNDEDVGNVDDVMAGADNQLEYVVVDVGGFLGLGEHTVAIGLDEVTILHDDADDLRLYVDVTEEALNEMPEHQR